MLGAGRTKKDDVIDMTAGIVFNKKVGDYISKEEVVTTIYSNSNDRMEEAESLIKNTIQISKEKQEKIPMIIDII